MSQPKTEPAALVAVINSENRVVKLHWQTPGQVQRYEDNGLPLYTPREMQTRVLGPGVNYIEADVLKRCGLEPGKRQGSLSVEDPRKIPDGYAADIAAKSGNRHALGTWLAQETRPMVRKAITDRLAKVAAG